MRLPSGLPILLISFTLTSSANFPKDLAHRRQPDPTKDCTRLSRNCHA